MSRIVVNSGNFYSTDKEFKMPPDIAGQFGLKDIKPKALKEIIEQVKSGKSNIKTVEIPVIEGKTKSTKTNGAKAKKAPATDGMDMTH